MRRLKGLRYTVGMLAVLSMLLAPAMVAAATTASVTIDVTPEYVAISNSNTSIDFGVLAAGLTNATTNSTTDYFDVTNDGTVNATVTVKCDEWAHQTGSHDWTYGSPAADTGQLVFSVGTGAYDTVVPASPSTESVFADLVPAATDYFEVGLDMPTSFTHGDQQQTTLTLTAAAL